jgi:hypothetical protein
MALSNSSWVGSAGAVEVFESAASGTTAGLCPGSSESVVEPAGSSSSLPDCSMADPRKISPRKIDHQEFRYFSSLVWDPAYEGPCEVLKLLPSCLSQIQTKGLKETRGISNKEYLFTNNTSRFQIK